MRVGLTKNWLFKVERFMPLMRFVEMDDCRNIWFFVLVMIVAALGPPLTAAAGAETAELKCPGTITVEGTLRNSAGDPIAHASVSLGGKDRTRVETNTNAEGNFVISLPGPGLYTLRAGKPGFHDAAMGPLALSAGEKKHFNLVLDAVSAEQVRPPLSSSSSKIMEFEDKPNFIVAGVTDWTAVGGHGADTNLRTSEALAKETLALKSEAVAEIPAGPRPRGEAASNESEAELKSALLQEPRSFDANHKLGEYYLLSGRHGEAIPPLETASQINPGSYPNRYDLALAYKANNDFARAREQVRSMLAKEDKAELHRLLGDLDEQLGNPLEAVGEFEKAVTLDPAEENYFRWGTELLLHRAIQPAAEVFANGAKAHPRSERMLAGLGAALYASGSYDQAALQLCAASNLNPADSGPYIFLGQMDRAAPAPLPCAESKLEKFVRDQPNNALANYYYATAIWKRQHEPADQEALRQVELLLEKAVALDPKLDEAYLRLGILYAAQGNSEKAIGAYQKALAIDSHLGEAHYRLAVAYQRTGEESKAQQQFELHDEDEKTEAAAVERQRSEIRQFLIVLKDQPQAVPVH
jgi:tetratricopeptide (TPR) repeat protein